DGNVFESLKAPLPKHKLNFELLAFRPLFKIKIGKANLKLVLDTTTQQNLISKSLAKKLKKSLLDARESETEIVGRIASCKLGKLEFGDMTYTLGDVSHLGSQKKLKADGILGRDFLSRMPFSLNFRKRSLSFY
ncbi:MAG: retroviral-like aspartic protease family protein, partial [Candidatus Cloacimonetes bacterium]|nr:retroviral-like aspartic protease family protein [Candidatus Cloacimonadota bacterium]